MKPSMKQLCVGLIPLAIGTVCNFLFLLIPVTMWIVNISFPILWGWLCYRAADRSRKLPGQILRINLLGTVMLALALYQELGRGAYFSGIAGLAPQFYFLPALSLFGRFIAPFLDVISSTPFFIAEYAGLFFISIAAVCLKKRRAKA